MNERSSLFHGLLLLLYVCSGTLQPILIEVLTYNGACEKSTFLFILPTYIGMSMSLLSNMDDGLKNGKIRWFKMILLAFVEICSAGLCFTGLVSAGSAVFTVIYSSVTVYTALFSRLFFGRELHYMQWGGVFLVMLGLISSSIGSSFNKDDNNEVGLGVIMIIIGSMFHSLVYILSESILKSENPVTPEFLGSFMGSVGMTYMYISIYKYINIYIYIYIYIHINIYIMYIHIYTYINIYIYIYI
jgi:drug/metabolite transporter (DMT)-like permease